MNDIPDDEANKIAKKAGVGAKMSADPLKCPTKILDV
jgi:hypothetical protein